MAKLKFNGHHWVYWCLACDTIHGFTDAWGFNQDLERPTLQSSLGTHGGAPGYCHAMLKDGVLVYLADSAHGLAGKSVPLPELPEWG
jgi:hypothetical protein